MEVSAVHLRSGGGRRSGGPAKILISVVTCGDLEESAGMVSSLAHQFVTSTNYCLLHLETKELIRVCIYQLMLRIPMQMARLKKKKGVGGGAVAVQCMKPKEIIFIIMTIGKKWKVFNMKFLFGICFKTRCLVITKEVQVESTKVNSSKFTFKL